MSAIKSTNDGSVKQYVVLSSSCRLGNVDNSAHSKSMVDYTVNLFYATMTTSEKCKETQLCDIERNQILTILSWAQINPFMAGIYKGKPEVFLSTSKVFPCFDGNANNILHLYKLSKKIVLANYQPTIKVQPSM